MTKEMRELLGVCIVCGNHQAATDGHRPGCPRDVQGNRLFPDGTCFGCFRHPCIGSNCPEAKKQSKARADLADWLPASMPTDTFRGVDRHGSNDTRLRGIRLPLPLHEHIRIALREIVPVTNIYDSKGMIPWMKNMMTRVSRDYVQQVQAIDTWENEGGQ